MLQETETQTLSKYFSTYNNFQKLNTRRKYWLLLKTKMSCFCGNSFIKCSFFTFYKLKHINLRLVSDFIQCKNCNTWINYVSKLKMRTFFPLIISLMELALYGIVIEATWIHINDQNIPAIVNIQTIGKIIGRLHFQTQFSFFSFPLSIITLISIMNEVWCSKLQITKQPKEW